MQTNNEPSFCQNYKLYMLLVRSELLSVVSRVCQRLWNVTCAGIRSKTTSSVQDRPLIFLISLKSPITLICHHCNKEHVLMSVLSSRGQQRAASGFHEDAVKKAS